jgi:hypothetical protein
MSDADSGGMMQTVPAAVRRCLRGFYPEGEATLVLVKLVQRHGAEIVLPLLTKEWIEKLKALAAKPPDFPQRVMIIEGKVSRSGFDPEAYREEEQRLWHDGVWKLHRFFRVQERKEH